MTALRKPTFAPMTVAEFLVWQPPDRADHRWQLVDGVPLCMAPASENHGAIQAEAALLIGLHLRRHRPGCRVITAPGVVPRVGADINHRVPDLGVTCVPPSGGHFITDPVLLVEILSPSNAAETRANVWAYATVPSVVDILLLDGTEIGGELLTRMPGEPWPAAPVILGADDEVTLAGIGLRVRVRDFYRTTSLW